MATEARTTDPLAGLDLSQQLVEAAPDATLVCDAGGVIVMVNRQAERLLGYERAELLGRPIEVLIPERFRERHVGYRSGYTGAPSPRPMGSGLDLRARHKDGRELAVEISLGPIETAGGIFMASTIRDVTERREAEHALRRLAAIVDASGDAIAGVSLDGTIMTWNRGAERLFGWTADEVLGRRPALVPRDLVDEERAMLERIERDEPVEHIETRRLRKDGTEVCVSLALSPILDALGRRIGVSHIARDITDRKRMEAEQRRTNWYLRSAVESISDAFVLQDEHDRVVLVNSAARHLFGRALEGPIDGRTFGDVLSSSLVALDPPDQSAGELQERWLRYHAAPNGALDLRTGAGRALRVTERRTAEGGTVMLVGDMTEDMAREDELRRARAQAEAASAAKSEFLSSMSHELRTPLNAILGFAQLLQRDKKTPLTDRQQERIAHVLRGGEHLLKLIDEVLDLSRIEAGRVTISSEAVSLAEVVAHVHATLEPMATRAHISLAPPSLPADLPLVRADRTRLAQILLNFGSNAIKYGRPGGRAWFRVTPVSGALRAAVIDDGIGIAEVHRGKLFEPFQRAGQETGPIEGTGIGLALSKRLAELMGGRVGFETELGNGSEFWVEVPLHFATTVESERPDAASLAGASLAGSGPRRTVVYVEDNPSNIAFMRELLSDLARIELVTAPTAEIGLELVRSHLPTLVIMDINLPGMSGFEATRRLAQWPETRGIPVVALSAAAMPRDVARGADGGFYRYLTKPVRVDELLELLEELIGRASE